MTSRSDLMHSNANGFFAYLCSITAYAAKAVAWPQDRDRKPAGPLLATYLNRGNKVLRSGLSLVCLFVFSRAILFLFLLLSCHFDAYNCIGDYLSLISLISWCHHFNSTPNCRRQQGFRSCFPQPDFCSLCAILINLSSAFSLRSFAIFTPGALPPSSYVFDCFFRSERFSSSDRDWSGQSVPAGWTPKTLC